MKLPLKDYQKPHFAHLLQVLCQTKSALDASETGSGKTFTALAIAEALGIVPLVVGPRFSRGVWGAASEACGVPIDFVNYEKLRGRRKAAEEGGRPVADTEWLVEVPWGKGSFLKWKHDFEFIIFDEVHRCGGATSLNSKALIAAKRQARLVLALSATAADDPRQMKALGYALGLHGLSKKSRLVPTYMNWLLRHQVRPGVFGGFDFTADGAKQSKAFKLLNSEIFPRHGGRMRKMEIPGFPKTQIDSLVISDESGKGKQLAAQLSETDTKPSDLELRQKLRQQLEMLKVPIILDMAQEYARTSKVVVYLNFTAPLQKLFADAIKVFGAAKVGFISGLQTGQKGERERAEYLRQFQANEIDLLVCNAMAAGESASMHDPTGHVERTALISPVESGRQYKQILGRVNRVGGAYSQQFILFFGGTTEEKVAERMKLKNCNIDLLNDADLMV